MIFGIIVFSIILLIYKPWFIYSGTLSSGDWPYLYLENIQEFSFLPNAQNVWLSFYYQIPTKILVQYLNIPWTIVERILWFFPFLAIGIFSSYALIRSWIGVLVYMTNTYILMVVGGGQMGIAMAYAIAPLILKLFFDNKRLSFAIAIGILIMFDPRIAYIVLVSIGIFILMFRKFSQAISILPASIPIALLINSFWLVPFLNSNLNIFVENFDNSLSFRFLSFADFSNTLSLLHPNWPENIFGKTYFLQPEFLMLPILAYSVLIFVSKIEDKTLKMKIIFFSLVGLIGVFLSKGSNPPLGFINEWFFQYIPGMSMFRDSTKFYILIALSYSALIPLSIQLISQRFSSRLRYLFFLLFVAFWLSLIYPAVFGQLTGTFKPQKVPQEYIRLKEFLLAKPEYFKTLWIPSVQRFGFVSKNHPGLSAMEYLKVSSVSLAISIIKKPETRKELAQFLIRYIIVPYDNKQELFITDRKYDENLYRKIIKELEQLSWMSKEVFGKTVVFEIHSEK